MKTLILASASPRRAALLGMAGYRFTVEPSDASEAVAESLSPSQHVAELARRKACAVAALHPDGLVLGADTVVAGESGILEKPDNRTHAIEMLTHLSGAAHAVFSGLCLVDAGTGRQWQCVEETDVTFRDVSPIEIERYADTAEPYDKAGAYAVQGRAASFVSRIDGCLSNVVGLPLAAFWNLLNTATKGNPWDYFDGTGVAPDLLDGAPAHSNAPQR